MGSLFSKPKTPEVKVPDPPPPPPERSAEDTAALAEEQRRKRSTEGRGSTSFTGGQGAGLGATALRYLGSVSRT